MLRRVWIPVAILAATLAGFVGCDDTDPADGEVDRTHRFGIFRDLVLFQRPMADGGPFFLDRFETTVADFVAAAAARGEVTPKPSPQGSLPKTGIDLYQARRFARWRFCRLPRRDEWTYACTQGGTYKYPWGDSWLQTWVNTGGLGLGRSTPVGTFESGRDTGGPFDLVGNVAEWTESVPVPFAIPHEYEVLVDRVDRLPEWPILETPRAPTWVPETTRARDGYWAIHWPTEQTGALPYGLRLWLPLWAPVPGAWLEQLDFEFRFEHWEQRRDVILDMPGVETYRRTPALGIWLPRWSPVPTDWLVMADSDLPRLVVGGNFRSRVLPNDEVDYFPHQREWRPGRRGDGTGLRLAADPEVLLCALLELQEPVEPKARSTLRRFLGRTSHLAVLRAAWPRVRKRVRQPGPLEALLAEELR